MGLATGKTAAVDDATTTAPILMQDALERDISAGIYPNGVWVLHPSSITQCRTTGYESHLRNDRGGDEGNATGKAVVV